MRETLLQDSFLLFVCSTILHFAFRCVSFTICIVPVQKASVLLNSLMDKNLYYLIGYCILIEIVWNKIFQLSNYGV